jgi:hypothetical protein
MPKPRTEDDKKHGDKLEPLIERASGQEGADDEAEELEDEDEDEDLDDDAEDDAKDDE